MPVRHMNKIIFYALVFSFIVSNAYAQSNHWHDQSGNLVPESSSMRSRDDFGGSLLITPDDDWKAKWNTPAEAMPNFNSADVVPYGKKVYVLIFFANPKLDSSGVANVRCDIQITDPTGKVAMLKKDLICFSEKIAGSQFNTYLSAPVFVFNGEPEDPPGEWIVDVSLRDANRHVDLPLRSSFKLH